MMPTTKKLTKEEKQWQAESDARLLAGAEVVKNTPTRLKAAKKEAGKQAVEQQKEAAAMKKVAKTKPAPKSKPAPKRSAGRRKKR